MLENKLAEPIEILKHKQDAFTRGDMDHESLHYYVDSQYPTFNEMKPMIKLLEDVIF